MNCQKFQKCQVLTKLVHLDHFKKTTYRTQPLEHIQIQLICVQFEGLRNVESTCFAPQLSQRSKCLV